MKARASRPIWLPVACQRERLKEQDVVMGRAVLEAKGVGALYCTRETPAGVRKGVVCVLVGWGVRWVG
jgi:hypothetical protein